jgi:hypothetical protein
MNTSIDIAIRRLGRMVGSFVSDWHSAQRLLLAYQLAPERFVFGSRGVPATYAEFLFMTSGKLPHEASARQRARGAGLAAG